MKNLVAVYSSYSSDNFDVGEIKTENSEELFLLSFQESGANDGYIYLKKEHIYRYEENSKYLKKINKVLETTNEISDFEELDVGIINILDDVIIKIIDQCLMISITVVDYDFEEILGFIKRKKDKYIEVEQYNYYGEPDGTSTIQIDSIIRLDIESSDEKLIKKLIHLK